MNWSYELVQSKLSARDMKQVHDILEITLWSQSCCLRSSSLMRSPTALGTPPGFRPLTVELQKIFHVIAEPEALLAGTFLVELIKFNSLTLRRHISIIFFYTYK